MLYSEKYEQGIYSECLRKIRTNLKYSLIDSSSNKIIVVSSSNPGEGKSTIVANLAFNMYQDNKRVLVIDADLRKPSVHKKFKITNEYGLTNILIHEKKFKEVVEEYKKGIDVITSGPIPPNPCELLGAESFTKFLDEVKKSYDYIIIDVPPIVSVADTQVVMNKADGLILVVRNDKTTKTDLLKAKKIIDMTNIKLLGSILNRDKFNSDLYRYY